MPPKNKTTNKKSRTKISEFKISGYSWYIALALLIIAGVYFGKDWLIYLGVSLFLLPIILFIIMAVIIIVLFIFIR